jgi:hypothetical protein
LFSNAFFKLETLMFVLIGSRNEVLASLTFQSLTFGTSKKCPRACTFIVYQSWTMWKPWKGKSLNMNMHLVSFVVTYFKVACQTKHKQYQSAACSVWSAMKRYDPMQYNSLGINMCWSVNRKLYLIIVVSVLLLPIILNAYIRWVDFTTHYRTTDDEIKWQL